MAYGGCALNLFSPDLDSVLFSNYVMGTPSGALHLATVIDPDCGVIFCMLVSLQKKVFSFCLGMDLRKGSEEVDKYDGVLFTLHLISGERVMAGCKE